MSAFDGGKCLDNNASRREGAELVGGLTKCFD